MATPAGAVELGSEWPAAMFAFFFDRVVNRSRDFETDQISSAQRDTILQADLGELGRPSIER